MTSVDSCHADLGLAPVGVGHADRAQHGAGRSTSRTVGDLVTPGAVVLSHGVRVASRSSAKMSQ
jgi:hypothetical protein